MDFVKIVEGLGFEVVKWFAGAGITAIVVWFVGFRQLAKRQFFSRINFSYNTVEAGDGDSASEGVLRLYTLMEKDLSEVLLNNRELRKRVLNAAKRATEEFPFIDLEKEDLDLLRIAVLNELADRYSEGLIDHAAGVAVTQVDLLFCVTFEPYGGVKIRKLRVMVVLPSVLEKFGDEGFCTGLGVLAEHHRDRIRTLQAMQKLWQEEQSRKPDEKTLVGTLRVWRRQC